MSEIARVLIAGNAPVRSATDRRNAKLPAQPERTVTRTRVIRQCKRGLKPRAPPRERQWDAEARRPRDGIGLKGLVDTTNRAAALGQRHLRRPNIYRNVQVKCLVAWLATRTDKCTVKRLVRIDWDTAADWQGLYDIGIDEVSWRKQHSYLTLVVDHQRRCVVWGTEGAGAEAADRFFADLDRALPADADRPRSGHSHSRPLPGPMSGTASIVSVSAPASYGRSR